MLWKIFPTKPPECYFYWWSELLLLQTVWWSIYILLVIRASVAPDCMMKHLYFTGDQSFRTDNRRERRETQKLTRIGEVLLNRGTMGWVHSVPDGLAVTVPWSSDVLWVCPVDVVLIRCALMALWICCWRPWWRGEGADRSDLLSVSCKKV